MVKNLLCPGSHASYDSDRRHSHALAAASHSLHHLTEYGLPVCSPLSGDDERDSLQLLFKSYQIQNRLDSGLQLCV